MKLKREYGLDHDLKYWALVPDTVDECAILHLIFKQYPHIFEFVSEITTGGLYREIYLKIKNIKESNIS